MAIAGISTLGKYSLTRELGRGGCGVVYLAEDNSLLRQVALKILHPALSSDPDFVAGFRQEARTIAGLSHPNIVRIHSLDQLDDHLVIDMEYVPGASLAQYIAATRPAPGFAMRVAYGVLNALHTCHSGGVVHRDLKPSNVLLDASGKPMLTDFGLAMAYALYAEASISKSSYSAFFLGTPRYAPPEAWTSEGPTPAWDLYSLGAVLYELLAGRPPYDGTSPLAIMRQLFAGPPIPIPDLNPAVSSETAEFVQRLMACNPADRPESATVALKQLKALPEFEPSSEHDIEPITLRVPLTAAPARAPERERRTKPRIGTALAIVIVLALAAVYGTVLRPWENAVPVTSTEPIPHSALRQSSLLQHEIPSVEELMSSSKSSPGTYRLFNATVREEDTRVLSRLFMETRNGAGRLRAVCAVSQSVWMLEVREVGEGGLVFDGHWAGYRYPSGGGLGFGRVSGNGDWMADQRGFVASLAFRDEQSGREITRTVSAELVQDSTTDTAFLFELEADELVQPLLYRELMPRKFSWASELDTLLPCHNNGHIRASYSGEAMSAVNVDGVLADAIWVKAGPTDALLGMPSQESPRLLARYNDTALFLGVQVPRTLPDTVGLEIVIMPEIAVPLSTSAIYTLTFIPGRDGIAVYRAFGKEARHEGESKASSTSTETGWSAEVEIPFASLGIEVSPQGGHTSRVNCGVIDWENAANPKTLYRWGFPDAANVGHGAVLSFEGRP